MLTGVIVKLGLINVDEKVINYLPKLKDSAFNETTVRQVLDMTAAVRYDEDYNNPTTDFWQETSAVGWSPNLLNKNSSDLFNYALSLKDKEQKDGSSYHYRTVLTNVLGMIIEAATGKKISILFGKKYEIGRGGQLWASCTIFIFFILNKIATFYFPSPRQTVIPDFLPYHILRLRLSKYLQP